MGTEGKWVVGRGRAKGTGEWPLTGMGFCLG